MKQAGGMAASEAQRQKVKGSACIVCWRGPCDPAHLIDRSLVPDPDGDPLRVVPLCRRYHDAYDAHELDLLPHLDEHGDELCEAVRIFGLISTLNRVTGEMWVAA